MHASAKTRLKLLVIGPMPPPVHGVAVMMETLVNSDLKNRCEFSSFDIADRSKNAFKTMSRFSVHNALLGLYHCFKLFFRIMIERPDVVYLFLSQSRWGFFRDAVFIRIARLFGSRVVINLGGSHFREFYEASPPRRRKRMKRILNKISVLEVLGENLRFLFQGLVPEERISVVPNGIEAKPYEAAAQCHRNNRPGKTILYMSTLNSEKGAKELIEAFNTIGEEFPDSRLLLAGAWSNDSAKIRILEIYENSLHKDRIEFLGVVSGESKQRALEEADVFVLPTYFHIEGQPVSILEAMASGLPVVSCDRGAVVDMIVDEKGGFIVEPKSSKSIAEALKKLFENPAMMKEFGEYNHNRFKQIYTLSTYIHNIEKDIHKAVS